MSDWGKVPKEVFTDRRLTRTEVRVLGILCAHANGRTGLCTRKQGTIAEELGLSRETVNRSMKKLTTLGYVEPRQRAGMKRSLDYRVLVSDGTAGQLGLFDTAEAPRQAKPRARKPAPRCDRAITSVVTPEITSVVTSGITPIEQTLVNREPVGSAQLRASGPVEPSVRADPAPIRPSGRGEAATGGDLRDRGERTGAAPAIPPREFMDRLEARLLDAAGPMLGRESIGLRMMTEPMGWIDTGCDLERDILPTIDGKRRRWEVAAVRPPPVNSWNYFAAAVHEARDRRLAFQPRPATPPGAAQSNIVPFDPRGSHGHHRDQPAKGRFTDAAARRRRQFAGDPAGEPDRAP